MDPGVTLPARYYVDPAVFAAERVAVFARSWVAVGYEFELAVPGAYLTEDVAGWPVFVWRDGDGQLRAFHNRCPHRAGPIVWEGHGCQHALVCRYHGWSFGPDGRLRSARDFGGPVEASLGLLPVRVATWRGTVWVCLADAVADVPGGEEPVVGLEEWLGGVAERCAAFPLERYAFHSRTVRRVEANWKTYLDNFNEGYHLATVHATTLARAVDARAYRVAVGEDWRWNVHHAPPRRAPGPEAEWSGVWAFVWPTWSCNVFDEGWAVERWLPRGPGAFDLVFEYFFAPGVDAEALVRESEVVADEDVAACVHVQRNLASGTYDVGPLSPRHEAAVGLYQRKVRELVAPLLGGSA